MHIGYLSPFLLSSFCSLSCQYELAKASGSMKKAETDRFVTTHSLPCLYSPCVPSINPVSLYHQGNCETFTREVHALLSAIHEPPACAKIWGADPQRDRGKNGAAPRREGLQNHGSHLFEKFVICDNFVACLLTHS